MRACAAASLEAAEKDLQQIYSKVLSKLTDESHRKALRASQEAWQRYRDAEVRLEGALYEGGTIRPQIELYCRASITRARSEELRRLLAENFDR
ncbi:hypothetical protein AMPC_28850 [Anaeromyxobacter paludicola]|uniref:Lysozyme inhibitor LprI-like N-terminal domain-containing protein n=2 Tax=Anaeromyxobacter paludicola TaxID=2918171 RepID=A0ABN6NCR8_9BACT|nr:hypothetical protein AMPC_28850 [Anaeromyxobacter paludicola]